MVRLGQQREDDDDRDQVARHDPDQPGAQVVPGGRAVPHAAGRGGVPAPQQETGQGEEHRDGQIEPVQQPADHPVGGAGLEGDVGQDHPIAAQARMPSTAGRKPRVPRPVPRPFP